MAQFTRPHLSLSTGRRTDIIKSRMSVTTMNCVSGTDCFVSCVTDRQTDRIKTSQCIQLRRHTLGGVLVIALIGSLLVPDLKASSNNHFRSVSRQLMLQPVSGRSSNILLQTHVYRRRRASHASASDQAIYVVCLERTQADESFWRLDGFIQHY